jgi:putative DNA primase/helicase
LGQPPLAAELKEELPGILNWALEGRERLRAKGRFTEPRLSCEALAEYRSESNPARTFLTEQCRSDVNARMPVEVVYQRYKSWATSHGHVALNGASFGKEVKKAFPNMRKARISVGDSRPWVYEGIALMSAEEVELPVAA